MNRKLRSVENFKLSIDKTDKFIHSIQANVTATETFLNETKAKSNPSFKKFADLLIFDKTKINMTWEMGIILLFSNFEFFMYELVKELLNRHPSALGDELSVKFSEIADLKDKKAIKDFVIDDYAIKKAYSVKSWSQFLWEKFKLKIFKSKKQEETILAFNALRNAFMHGGGKTNVEFRRKMGAILKAKIPLNQKINLNRSKLFHGFLSLLHAIIKNLK